jgi:hypothetical protein
MRHQVAPLRHLPRKRPINEDYEQAVPGDCVQPDTIRIPSGKCQRTAYSSSNIRIQSLPRPEVGGV